MKVLGAELGAIRAMFLTESAMIGLIGGVVGVGLSFLISYLLNNVPIVANLLASLGLSFGNGGAVSIIPWWLVLVAMVFSMMVGVFSVLSLPTALLRSPLWRPFGTTKKTTFSHREKAPPGAFFFSLPVLYWVQNAGRRGALRLRRSRAVGRLRETARRAACPAPLLSLPANPAKEESPCPTICKPALPPIGPTMSRSSTICRCCWPR